MYNLHYQQHYWSKVSCKLHQIISKEEFTQIRCQMFKVSCKIFSRKPKLFIGNSSIKSNLRMKREAYSFVCGQAQIRLKTMNLHFSQTVTYLAKIGVTKFSKSTIVEFTQKINVTQKLMFSGGFNFIESLVHILCREF